VSSIQRIAHSSMPSDFEILCAEIGVITGRMERELGLKTTAALADLQRHDAERETRFVDTLAKLERREVERNAYFVQLEIQLRKTYEEKMNLLQDGKDGLPGIQGERGERGLQGERGEQGVPGQGQRGLQGERGEKGEPGPVGKGERGEPGERGERGEPGLTGERGEKGDSIVGKDGADGVAGLPGERGERGEKGEPGIEGKSIMGTQGPQGERGMDGGEGQRGERGERGDNGLNGTHGEKGETGVGVVSAVIDRDGTLVLSFTDGTLRSLGNVVGRDGRAVDRKEIDQLINEKFALLHVDKNDDAPPQDVMDQVSKVMNLMTNPPPTYSADNGNQNPSIVLNMATSERRKTIRTHKDANGNMVADVVERDY